MSVLILSNVPESVTGYTSAFMVQVSPTTFVGAMSSRVRGELWQRVVTEKGIGSAVFIESDNSELGFTVNTHMATWEDVCFDGVTLTQRPTDNESSRRAQRYIDGDERALMDLEN